MRQPRSSFTISTNHQYILGIALAMILCIQTVLSWRPEWFLQTLNAPSCHLFYCSDSQYQYLRLMASIDSYADNTHFLNSNIRIENTSKYLGIYLPHIRLSFTNTAGEIVADRIFSPREYLPKIIRDSGYLLSKGQSLVFNLAILDPGNNATGYQFSIVHL